MVSSIALIFLALRLTVYRTNIIVLGIFSFLFFSWKVFPFYGSLFAEDRKFPSDKILRTFYANINSQNAEKELLVSYLQAKQPDIVFLVEINTSWAQEIAKLKIYYPYSEIVLRENNFGLGILSKMPLEVENVFVDRENMVPALFLKAQSPLGPLNLILLHPVPPLGQYATFIRNQYLVALSHRVRDIYSPILVCGDFNTTPWSSIFKEFLKNSELEFNYGARTPITWPTNRLFPGIPIDHCLAKRLEFARYETGPDIGSDHWPLIVDLVLKGQAVAIDK